jgi:Ca2+/Na+ antiporter
MATHALFFLLGLAALVLGAEALVRGASKIALSLGISPLVVGLTIVAVGTSSPEVAVSVGAVLNGTPAYISPGATQADLFPSGTSLHLGVFSTVGGPGGTSRFLKTRHMRDIFDYFINHIVHNRFIWPL